MDTGDSPLVTTGLPSCPYRITSYTGPAVADTNPAFGMQLHHPLFLEFIGAPESAWRHSPAFWVQRLGEEDALAAAVNLQRDAGLMLSNLQIQILSQFVTSMHRMSTEMMTLGMGHVVFPSEEVAALSTTPRAPRAAKYMAVMGLWRPQTGQGDPRAGASFILQCQHDLSVLLYGMSDISSGVILDSPCLPWTIWRGLW